MISDDELLRLDEFGLLPENAEQAGIDTPLPAVHRLDLGGISAIAWGQGPPEILFLHGGGQNAHTWDTVILGLGLPALAVDLPGHDLVLVDVTPSAPERHEQMTKAQLGAVALVRGERSFPSFAAILDEAVAASPQRNRESLRRGVFHNSRQLDDGTWTWRYDSFRTGAGFEGLWDDVPAITMPTTLVRGANSFFVNDEDADQFARSAPGFRRTIVVPDAGHSVQGDQPRALIAILAEVLDAQG